MTQVVERPPDAGEPKCGVCHGLTAHLCPRCLKSIHPRGSTEMRCWWAHRRHCEAR